MSDHATVQERIYHYQTCIHNTDELKQRLIQFRYNLDEISINTAIDQWCKRLSVSSCEGRWYGILEFNVPLDTV